MLVLILVTACGGGPSADRIEPERLTEEWPCGFGFRLSDPDQTTAVWIAFEDEPAAAAGEVPRRVELPDEEWTATVRLGRDLFANWCDDVMEPGEPEPVLEAEWPIVAGTLELEGELPEGICGGGPVTLHAQGLVVERPDGGRQELGDLEITNTAWGCFAG